MTREQFEDICKWQSSTFGQATALSKIAHLKQEIEELNKDLNTWETVKSYTPYPESFKQEKRMEFADCFILLFGAANSDGMNYDDICKAIYEKMEINKNRKWGTPDENGVVNHIK